MAFSSNPKIPTDGLVLALDPADTNSYRRLSAVEVMVVGGGGGGGMDMGGGGGGGGVLYDPNYLVTPGVGITVTVGAGGFGAPGGNGGYRTDGAGPQPNSHQFTISATNGSDSVFGNLIAKGGGFGASSYYGYTPNSGTGGNGASGGGCSAYTHGGERYVDTNNIVGQGYPGGNSGNPASGGDDHYSGGGGGAGGRGTSGPNHVAPSGTAGHGGPGVLISRMSPYYYSGGGGGSCHSGTKGGDGGLGGGGGGAAGGNGNTVGFGDTNGRNAAVNGGLGNNQPGGNAGANTGGGGGGGSHYNVNNKGGEGGSGIVIIRYNGPQAASGGTYTFVNGVSFHTFTSSGTFTPYSSTDIWYDTSGNGYHFTLSSSSVRQVSGNKVYMDFKNGIAKYLPGGTLTNVPAYSNVTICIFSNIQVNDGDWKTLIRATTTGGPNLGDDHQVIIYAGDGVSLGMYDNNGQGFQDTGFDMNSISNYTTDFHFYVWKLSNTSPYYQFYYDNNLDTATATLTNSNATFTQGFACIGAYHNGSTSPGAYSQEWGHIGPFLYYNRHLNASELRQIYNTFKTRYQ